MAIATPQRVAPRFAGPLGTRRQPDPREDHHLPPNRHRRQVVHAPPADRREERTVSNTTRRRMQFARADSSCFVAHPSTRDSTCVDALRLIAYPENLPRCATRLARHRGPPTRSRPINSGLLTCPNRLLSRYHVPVASTPPGRSGFAATPPHVSRVRGRPACGRAACGRPARRASQFPLPPGVDRLCWDAAILRAQRDGEHQPERQ